MCIRDSPPSLPLLVPYSLNMPCAVPRTYGAATRVRHAVLRERRCYDSAMRRAVLRYGMVLQRCSTR
eukprot:2877120-Rhodomonas_salina.5